MRLLLRGLEAASTQYPLIGCPVPTLSPILSLIRTFLWVELVLYYDLFLLLYLMLVRE